jgi:Glycosyl hydrolases family 32 N-terminal domain
MMKLRVGNFLKYCAIGFFALTISALAPLGYGAEAANTMADPCQPLSAATLAKWSAPFRHWHYWPTHVIPSSPPLPGATNIMGTDIPTIYQIPGDNKWYMSFVAFDGKGYQSYVAESTDLVHWGHYRLAMGYGPKGEFDHGGRTIGGFLLQSCDLKAPRRLKKWHGKYWTLYGAYAQRGGYELDPDGQGLAESEDGLTWHRAQDEPVLSLHDPDCGEWESDRIYMPWLLEYRGRFFDFYNAAHEHHEQSGVAFSTDLRHWIHYPANPILRDHPGGYDAAFASDPKVYHDGDHWTMFYFGVGHHTASIMVAFSRDLMHWTSDPIPLYKGGGNPSGLDREYAHKVSLVYNPRDDTFYMFYCAVPGKKGEITGGRGIGLITSKPLKDVSP